MASEPEWRPQTDGRNTRERPKGLVALCVGTRVAGVHLLPYRNIPDRLPVLRTNTQTQKKFSL